jgi:hypothetical protein
MLSSSLKLEDPSSATRRADLASRKPLKEDAAIDPIASNRISPCFNIL